MSFNDIFMTNILENLAISVNIAQIANLTLKVDIWCIIALYYSIFNTLLRSCKMCLKLHYFDIIIKT